mmetsp:Transcript_73699/g.130098  ORF Transcript_73699/g.130098 Transcript_73699/m.130098 type:complete len:661 (+) Transcript_73699:83-2065(+)
MRLGCAKSPSDNDIGILTRIELKEELKEQLDKLRAELFEDLANLGSGGSVSSAPRPTTPRDQPNKHARWSARDNARDVGKAPQVSMPMLSHEEEEMAALAKRGFRKGIEGEYHADELLQPKSSRSRSRGEHMPGPTAYSPLGEESDEEAMVVESYVPGRDERTLACCIATKDIDPDHPLAQEPGVCNWRYSLRMLVDSDPFAYIITSLVVLNAVLIGVETDYSARHLNEKLPGSKILGRIFCWIFTFEVSSRLVAYGCFHFFTGHEWKWNVFDFTVVSLQWFEEAANLVTSGKGGMNLGFLRILRTLRVARIMRLARILHLVVELRSMITSIYASLKPLAWAMLLFSMLIYAVAVAMTQMANEFREQAIRRGENDPHLDRYFNTLGTAILALWECISGGMDWESVATPLIHDVSPVMGLVFSAYVAFSMLAMMNVITGIFVDNATTSAQHDKDTYVVKHVINLFKKSELTAEGSITWKVFAGKLVTKELRELFKAVDVDVADAESLFRLIDTDGNGTVSPDELMRGWIRLRGPAKALDLSLLIQETQRSAERQHRLTFTLIQCLDWACQALDSLLDANAGNGHSASGVGRAPSLPMPEELSSSQRWSGLSGGARIPARRPTIPSRKSMNTMTKNYQKFVEDGDKDKFVYEHVEAPPDDDD